MPASTEVLWLGGSIWDEEFGAPDCCVVALAVLSDAGLTIGLALRDDDLAAALKCLGVFLADILPNAWTFFVRLSTCASSRVTRFFSSLAIPTSSAATSIAPLLPGATSLLLPNFFTFRQNALTGS